MSAACVSGSSPPCPHHPSPPPSPDCSAQRMEPIQGALSTTPSPLLVLHVCCRCLAVLAPPLTRRRRCRLPPLAAGMGAPGRPAGHHHCQERRRGDRLPGGHLQRHRHPVLGHLPRHPRAPLGCCRQEVGAGGRHPVHHRLAARRLRGGPHHTSQPLGEGLPDVGGSSTACMGRLWRLRLLASLLACPPRCSLPTRPQSSCNACIINICLQVAFADPSHDGKLSVKRWVQASGKWEYVGPPAISPGPVQRAPCLTFSPKGEPWIAFQVRRRRASVAVGALSCARFLRLCRYRAAWQSYLCLPPDCMHGCRTDARRRHAPRQLPTWPLPHTLQGASLKPTAARYNKLDKQWYSASVLFSPDSKTSYTADWVTMAAGANG